MLLCLGILVICSAWYELKEFHGRHVAMSCFYLPLTTYRFVLASDERRDYFAILFYIYIAVVSSVSLLSLFHSPTEDGLEVSLEGLERAEAGDYLVQNYELGLADFGNDICL